MGLCSVTKLSARAHTHTHTHTHKLAQTQTSRIRKLISIQSKHSPFSLFSFPTHRFSFLRSADGCTGRTGVAAVYPLIPQGKRLRLSQRETDRGERVMLSWLDLCTVRKHGGRETKCPQGFMKPTVSTLVPSRLRVTLQWLLGKFKHLNPVTMHCTNWYLSCTNSRLYFTLGREPVLEWLPSTFTSAMTRQDFELQRGVCACVCVK